MLRLLLVLILVSCNQGSPLPHKVYPGDPGQVHEEQPVGPCTKHNDCPVALLCNTLTGQCVECLNDDHCMLGSTCEDYHCVDTEPTDPSPSDPYTPGDPGQGDPGNPGDPDQPEDTCTVGTCTLDSGYLLCLEDGEIPLENPYCDYYTYEGCPDYMTPFLVTWSDGWEDCLCIEECTL